MIGSIENRSDVLAEKSDSSKIVPGIRTCCSVASLRRDDGRFLSDPRFGYWQGTQYFLILAYC